MQQQEVADRLADILAARNARAEQIRERLRSWRGLHESLTRLQRSLQAFSEHPDSPATLGELVREMDDARLNERIGAEVVPRLQRVESRSRRSSVNIGVAGKARMGKSTLLQSVSGLGDGQIPTGDALPVTAVRSRIFHSTEQQRAIISFHTWASFREEVLAPYFRRLGWGAAPQAVEDFRLWSAPPVPEGTDETVFLTSLRDRLERMQRSLPSYRGYLNGDRIELGLDAIREFVAYPDSDEERTGAPARKYLAVREARIECAFPGVSVRRLGLIDLPGTGEIVAEERHVADLDDEVDVVLLITNPDRLAYWDKESAQTLDLVLQARAGVSPTDFAVVVINTGGASDGKRNALRDDIQRRLHRRSQGVFALLETDAIDPDDVRRQLVRPVLNHLAERLGAMDAAALAYAEAELGTLREEIGAVLERTQVLLEHLAPAATPIEVMLVSETERLRRELARRFSQIVERRLRAARGPEAEDAAFEEAVSRCYTRAREWLADGLGKGEAAWIEDAERALQGNKGSGELSETELNRVRVHVSSEFNSLDGHLIELVSGLWGELWAALSELLGLEADGVSAGAGLAALEAELRAVGSSAMASAVSELLSLRLDYRTHFHPRMRRELDVLSPQLVDRDSGRQRPRIVVAPSLEGAHEMLALLREFGEQAAYEAQKTLLAGRDAAGAGAARGGGAVRRRLPPRRGIAGGVPAVCAQAPGSDLAGDVLANRTGQQPPGGEPAGAGRGDGRARPRRRRRRDDRVSDDKNTAAAAEAEQQPDGGMRIALAAPSGVGKTSVLTALLDEANAKVLAGTPVSVEALGPTRRRLNRLKNALKGHLRAREFVPGGIGGTQSVNRFELAIQAALADRSFRLEFLDYPGGLLEGQEGESWRQLKAWFRSADVLLLPIDATLLMEAVTPRQHQRAQQLLDVAEMESTASRYWAKARAADDQPPGLLVLAPVKCESYLSDNGGRRDRADALLERIRATYSPLVEAVLAEAPGTEVLYCPIDTIGCVEVLRVEWPSPGDEDGYPVPHYRVRSDAELRQKGADDLFIALVRRILGDARQEQKSLAQLAEQEASSQQKAAEANKGLVQNFWMWLSGERRRLRQAAGRASERAEQEQLALEQLQETLTAVSQRPFSGRLRPFEA